MLLVTMKLPTFVKFTQSNRTLKISNSNNVIQFIQMKFLCDYKYIRCSQTIRFTK